jgi:quinoprotein glucose dehydrogenase
MRITSIANPIVLILVFAAALAAAQGDWPTYGHDPGSTHYSPLTQVNTKNVSKLQRAWTYHMAVAPTTPEPPPVPGRGGGSGGRGTRSEATPIVVDGIMYLPTPYHRVVALEPETGKQLWVHDLGSTSASTRGVEYWPGDADSPPTIFFATNDSHLVALNAKTGKLVPGFGSEGMLNMKEGVDNGVPNGQYSLSSPPKSTKIC